MEMEFHPIANLFPLIEGEDFQKLVEDIRDNGQKERILTYDGKIIDGRNRYRACKEAGVEPEFKEWDGNGSLASLVMSLNLNRRHLNKEQRAMIVVSMKPYLEEEARKRQEEGRKAGGHAKHGDTSMVENLPPSRKVRDELAKAADTSGKLIDFAEKVKEKGVPELAQAVNRQEISISAAAEVADLPPDKQLEVVKSGKKAAAKVAKEARQRRKEVKAAKAAPSDASTSTPESSPETASKDATPVTAVLEEHQEETGSDAMAIADQIVKLMLCIRQDDPKYMDALCKIYECFQRQKPRKPAGRTIDIPISDYSVISEEVSEPTEQTPMETEARQVSVPEITAPALEETQSEDKTPRTEDKPEDFIRESARRPDVPSPPCHGHYNDDMDECFRSCKLRKGCMDATMNKATAA